MWGAFRGLRAAAWRSRWGGRPGDGSKNARMRGTSQLHAAAGAFPLAQVWSHMPKFGLLGAGAGVGAVTATSWQRREREEELHPELAACGWVAALASERGMREVAFPGRMLRTHPVGALVSENDHLVRGHAVGGG